MGGLTILGECLPFVVTQKWMRMYRIAPEYLEAEKEFLASEDEKKMVAQQEKLEIYEGIAQRAYEADALGAKWSEVGMVARLAKIEFIRHALEDPILQAEVCEKLAKDNELMFAIDGRTGEFMRAAKQLREGKKEG